MGVAPLPLNRTKERVLSYPQYHDNRILPLHRSADIVAIHDVALE